MLKVTTNEKECTTFNILFKRQNSHVWVLKPPGAEHFLGNKTLFYCCLHAFFKSARVENTLNRFANKAHIQI